MEQQLPPPGRLVILAIAVRVLANVRVQQPSLVACDLGKAILQLNSAVLGRLDFGSGERKSGFKPLQESVGVAGMAIVAQNFDFRLHCGLFFVLHTRKARCVNRLCGGLRPSAGSFYHKASPINKMLAYNNLRGLAILAAVLILLPVPGADASNRKGDRFMKLGLAAEARKDYDAALEYYTKALSTDPKEVSYQLATRRIRFQASQAHVEAGMRLRQAGKLEEALVEFQKAFSIDPGSTVALQEIKHTTDALDQVKKGNVRPGETPLTPAEQSRVDSVRMIESMLPVPVLKPITSQISSLKMNNQPPKVLYETVGKLAGINVLFDPQMQPGRPSNLDLNNTTLDEALDYIALLTKTFWKPVSANAIFVTEDNVTKRRDYEDEVVKVFYLRNPTTVQEFQEIITAVRSVTDVRRMFTYNAQNAVMVRDTVDKVALVEKLLRDMDKPKAEVVVDMIVMEVNSDRSRTIAAGLVSNGTTGLAIPIGFSPTNPVLQGTGTTSGTGTARTGISVTGTGTMLQAVMSDTSTKVMQSPEVRVSDGQKAELKIGDRIPYASGSFQPGIGTVGVSPLVSTH